MYLYKCNEQVTNYNFFVTKGPPEGHLHGQQHLHPAGHGLHHLQ